MPLHFVVFSILWIPCRVESRSANGGGCPKVIPEFRGRPHKKHSSGGQIRTNPSNNDLSSGQAFLYDSVPSPRGAVLVTFPGTGSSNPPSQFVEELLLLLLLL